MVAASLKSNGRTRAALDRFLGTLLTASLVLAISHCGDSTGPTPTRITLSTTSVSFDALGETQQLTATVLDQDNLPLQGSTVTWSSTDALVASVDNTGLVTAVGNGTVQITASSGSASSSATVTVAQVVTQLQKTAGDLQSVTAGTAVPIAPTVLGTDARANPVAGANVTFAVASGGGSVTGGMATTDAGGVASVGSWTLGTVAGPNELTATVTGSAPSTFTATGVPGPAVAVSITAGNNQTGLVSFALNVDPSVRVEDSNGNGVSGVSVAFAAVSGGGSVTGSPVTTDAGGIAAVGSWVLGAAVGTNTMTATATGFTPVTFTASGVMSSYNIEVRFLAGTTPTASQQAAFDNAKARWETLIFGDLLDFPLMTTAGECGPNSPAINETVDDLLILTEFVAIDGPGGVVGSAGPCFIRQFNPPALAPGDLTILGLMTYDTDDLASLEAAGALEGIIVHEIAHAVGFGALWGPTVFDLLVNPSVTGGAGVDTHFNGPEAIAAFDEIGGTGYTAGGKVPVENSGVAGQADGHWRESVFGTELMTAFLSAATDPLSIVTTASMLDLGYQANLAASDALMLTFPFSLPGRGPLRLKDEIIRGPIYLVNRSGTVVGVVHR